MMGGGEREGDGWCCCVRIIGREMVLLFACVFHYQMALNVSGIL